ncbi:MAG TPA: NUDIX domain-containing protein [Acidimicrobiales bacterium]|nr:NUDIX domain-containing protein [Acidimicrobiales bacterium]
MWTLRRRAARLVVLDPSDRVLLLQARDPVDPAKGEWWEIPGGGIEAGETGAEAAERELEEETGITGVAMWGCAWRQRSRFVFAGIGFDQDEEIHVARVATPALDDDWKPSGLEALEAAAFQSQRWWELDELEALVEGGGRVIPPWLAGELRRYLAEGPPAEPVVMG